MKKFWKDFNLLGFLMLVVCVVLGVGDMSGAVMTADGATASYANETGARVADTGDGGTTLLNNDKGDALSTWDYRRWSPDLIKDPVEKQVIQIRPYANVLDTILSYIGSEKINNFEFYYWQIASRDLKYKVAYFKPAEVDEAKKDQATGELYLEGNNQVCPTDNILIADPDNVGKELYLYVISVENATELPDKTSGDFQKCLVTTDAEQVVASSTEGKFKIPDITADTDDKKSAYLCGRSAGELDTTSPAIEYVPTKKKGYAQIFKTEVTISNFAKMADKEIKWDLAEIEEEALFDYRRTKEKSFLFGRMSKIYDNKKRKEIYRTGGIFRTVLEAQGSPYVVNASKTNMSQKDANDTLTDMMKEVFVGNNGAKERFMLAGSEAVARLTKMMGVAQKQQGALETEIIMGITWTKIVSPFGTLNLVSHPIFDETPYGEYALVIDPQFLKKKEVLPMDRQQVDGKEHLIVNGDIVIFSETAGVAVYNPKAHHVLKIS